MELKLYIQVVPLCNSGNHIWYSTVQYDKESNGTVHVRQPGLDQCANKIWFQAPAYHLWRRAVPTIFKWTEGHLGECGNEEVNCLTNEGTHNEAPDDIVTTIPNNFYITGIKLLSTTQALAYSAITQSNPLPLTDITNNNIECTRHKIQDMIMNLKTTPSIYVGVFHIFCIWYYCLLSIHTLHTSFYLTLLTDLLSILQVTSPGTS